ncbi:MAG TPA: ABC transporter permease [Candidatus Angelobacter sp.]|nr:ABC transporter permease [Candidatus Angelobacter sp.]
MGLGRFFRRGSEDAELERELQAHVNHEIDENIAAGMAAEEARRQAYIKLGSRQRVREDVWRWNTVGFAEGLWQDLRYAARNLRRMPGFAIIAILTLALGSGATTVMFTVINGVLLKPLPYAEPDQLVGMMEKTEKATQYGNLWAFAYPNFLDCRSDNHSLLMAAYRYSGGTVTVSQRAEYVDGREVSAELFSVLGIGMLQGRAFRAEEDRQGAPPVAVISYNLWQHNYGGEPGTAGRPLTFDGKTYTVVGITPPRFQLNGDEVDIYTPIGQDSSPSLQARDRHPGINVIARLMPGVTLTQARSELELIGRRLAAQYPDSNSGRSFIAEPLRPNVGDVGATLWLMLGAVSMVLLIACANVANLLLARSVSREREFATRVALGASRARLVRQCLTESAVLGLTGGALGVFLAAIGIRPFVSFWPGSLPRAEEVYLDWRVLLFAVSVSLASGFLFGLAPAFRLPVHSLESALRAGAKTISGKSRLHGTFVASEMMLALVLLVAAGILGRTLLRLSSLQTGLNVQNVLVTRMALSAGILKDPARTRAAWQEVLDRARAVPGVQAAAIVDTVPMREGNNQVGFWNSAAMPPRNEIPLALATSVTPDYLKVMGIALLKGRFFDDRDRMGSQSVVIIDDVLAQQAFPGQEAVGKLLRLPVGSTFSTLSNAPDSALVVGVVGHVRHWGLASDDDSKVRAQFYYPFAQVADPLVHRWSELMSLAVRTDVAPLSVLEPLRQAVRGAAGDQVLYQVHTLEQLATATLDRQRFLLMLFGIFAGPALLLACVGIYGVLAYLTSQRIPEFGIRMALGANARDVMNLVLRQSAGMILAWAGLGLAAALGAVRLLQHMVPGVRSMDPLAFMMMLALLFVAALAASFVPARRASRIDPMSALRQE